MKSIAASSVKGGVGKTTAAVNLADAAAATGARVLVWDLDPQGAATFCFRVRPEVAGGARALVKRSGALWPHVRATDTVGIDLVPADLSLRHLDLHLHRRDADGTRIAELLARVAEHYDLAVLDCPPGVTLASEGVITAVDALVVPVVPSTLSHRTLAQLSELVDGLVDGVGDATDHRRPASWPFASMVDRRRAQHRRLVETLADEPGSLSTVIPASSIVERMGAERAPLRSFAPRHRATAAFTELWTEIAERLW